MSVVVYGDSWDYINAVISDYKHSSRVASHRNDFRLGGKVLQGVEGFG